MELCNPVPLYMSSKKDSSHRKMVDGAIDRRSKMDPLTFSKEHQKYLREHAKRLKQLERIARGEQVPGDYDGGYDD